MSLASHAWLAAARRRLAGLGMAVALAAGPVAAQTEERPPEPSGYRMDVYLAPTPVTLSGARVLDTASAEALWREKGAVFVDTMPRAEKPPNLPAGTIWRDRPRAHIPGSAWLANAGYGALSVAMNGYVRDGLKALTAGDPTRPLAFYCKAQCWMSWNAAKRALALGYVNVAWYPDGTDGWTAAGLPLATATPYAPGAPTN